MVINYICPAQCYPPLVQAGPKRSTPPFCPAAMHLRWKVTWSHAQSRRTCALLGIQASRCIFRRRKCWCSLQAHPDSLRLYIPLPIVCSLMTFPGSMSPLPTQKKNTISHSSNDWSRWMTSSTTVSSPSASASSVKKTAKSASVCQFPAV